MKSAFSNQSMLTWRSDGWFKMIALNKQAVLLLNKYEHAVFVTGFL